MKSDINPMPRETVAAWAQCGGAPAAVRRVVDSGEAADIVRAPAVGAARADHFTLHSKARAKARVGERCTQ
jgi:hypothetical protein